MRMAQILDESRVIPDLVGSGKNEILILLSEYLAKDIPDVEVEDILDILVERESVRSTAIGRGIAVPHGKLEGLEEPVVVLARSSEGVPFEAADGRPVRLIVALISPAVPRDIHLNALIMIHQMLRNTEIRDQLLNADGQRSLYEVAALVHSEF